MKPVLYQTTYNYFTHSVISLLVKGPLTVNAHTNARRVSVTAAGGSREGSWQSPRASRGDRTSDAPGISRVLCVTSWTPPPSLPPSSVGQRFLTRILVFVLSAARPAHSCHHQCACCSNQSRCKPLTMPNTALNITRSHVPIPFAMPSARHPCVTA